MATYTRNVVKDSVTVTADRWLRTDGANLTLSSLMDFDHVIRVHADGTVTDAHDVYAPELFQDEGPDGIWRETLHADGWTLMNGYTDQYGYNGPMMHQSEFIGGRMADDILSQPGYYVAVYPICTDAEGNDVEADSWAVAYRPAE